MATTAPNQTTAATAPTPTPTTAPATEELGLKHLEFVRHYVINLYIVLFKLYEQAKENSGTLRPGIDRVESVVRTVVGPVLTKVEGKPDELFRFADEKVDVAFQYVDAHIPKDLANRATDFVRSVPVRAKEAIHDYQEKGAYGTAKSYYDSVEPVVAAYVVFLWRLSLSTPIVAQAIVAAYPHFFALAGKYNTLVQSAQKADYPYVKTAVEYLPVFPVEKAESYVKQSLEKAGVC
eukprot:TRINITY_DN10083_c0_g1_i1.p1 TRINITY_DN10083_c0_g1~~TRINITY_DN10083_c0_g1_i1.p1  ORF type:complete len:235 (-),score=13.98 TRINITY_DN10083_c0_g1_i1:282-986(-)